MQNILFIYTQTYIFMRKFEGHSLFKLKLEKQMVSWEKLLDPSAFHINFGILMWVNSRKL